MPIIYYQRPLISKETIKAAVFFFIKISEIKILLWKMGQRSVSFLSLQHLFAMSVTFVIFF